MATGKIVRSVSISIQQTVSEVNITEKKMRIDRNCIF